MVGEPGLDKTLNEIQNIGKRPLGTVSAVGPNDDGNACERAERDDDGRSMSHSSIGSTGPCPVGDIEENTHSKSRPSSVRSKAATIIPRSKRRGLFGRVALIPEVSRPPEYTRKTKWLITFIVALAAAAAPMGSAIFFRESILCS